MATLSPPTARPVRVVPAPAAPQPARVRRAGQGLRELLLLLALWGAYALARTGAPDDVAAADASAARLLGWERALGLDVEAGANAWLGAHRWAEVAASTFYAGAHYVVTAAVLLLLWWRHREHYRAARRALLGATAVALACYVAVPTTPPRLLDGYTDSLAATADVGWWGSAASAPAGMGDLTNQYAALPSMHVGWALWCSLAVAPLLRRRRARVAAHAYPVLVVLVVVVTANHWVLDALAGAALVLAAVRAEAALRARLGRSLTARAPGRERGRGPGEHGHGEGATAPTRVPAPVPQESA